LNTREERKPLRALRFTKGRDNQEAASCDSVAKERDEAASVGLWIPRGAGKNSSEHKRGNNNH
jgi:hypothetical protein